MRTLVAQGVRALVMGTRGSDPDGSECCFLFHTCTCDDGCLIQLRFAEGLHPFTPTSKGWPPMMRVSPILAWEYTTVWTFLRSLKLPYCSLYDEG